MARRTLRRLSRVRAFARYLRDPKASLVGKLFVAAAAAYVVWPADLIPDVPLVGWLDDLGVAGVALAYLGRVVDPYRDGAKGRGPSRDHESAEELSTSENGAA